MINLGGNMSNRIDKYNLDQNLVTKRSQRNKVLYEKVDIFDDDYDFKESLFSEIKNQVDQEKTNHVLDYYQNEEQKFQEIPKEDEIETKYDWMYYDLMMEDYYTLQELKKQREYRRKQKEESEKIRKLIDMIISNSNLNRQNNSIFPLKEFNNNHSSLNSKNLVTTDISNPTKEYNFLSSLNGIFDDSYKQKGSYLKLKIVVGILFVIVSIIIGLLIYKDIQ